MYKVIEKKYEKRIFIPQNFNIKELVKMNAPNFKFQIDYFKYLIHLIITVKISDRKLHSSLKGWIPLSSVILKSIISNYQKYLYYLIENEVIECNSSYSVGNVSKSYRLAERYKTGITEDFIFKPIVVNKISALEQKLNRQAKTKYKFLTKWFDGLEINMIGVNEYLIKLKNQHSNLRTKKLNKKTINKIISYEIMAKMLFNKEYYFKVDESGNRLHTNLTNLKKELRNYITYKGESIVAIDLCCSQPYLSQILFNKSFYQKQEEKNKINIYKISYAMLYRLKHVIKQSEDINPMCVESLYALDNQIEMNNGFQNDTLIYKDKVNKGEFYEFIQEVVQHKFNLAISRKDAKKIILTILFADNNDKRPNFIKNRMMFKETFPLVYKIFDFYKINAYSTLAILLQKIESTIFLDRIARRISVEHPTLPIFTIHDSICTTVGNEEIVSKIAELELTELVGFKPTLKYEYWLSDTK